MSVGVQTMQPQQQQRQQQPSPSGLRRGRPLAQRAKGLRERAWWVMRERRKFTLNLLLETLADGGEKDAAGNLLKYIRRLESVGVLARSKHRLAGDCLTSPGYAVWVLVRDLGRQAPVWRKPAGALWDPNSQTVVLKATPTTQDVEAA